MQKHLFLVMFAEVTALVTKVGVFLIDADAEKSCQYAESSGSIRELAFCVNFMIACFIMQAVVAP